MKADQTQGSLETIHTTCVLYFKSSNAYEAVFKCGCIDTFYYVWLQKTENTSVMPLHVCTLPFKNFSFWQKLLFILHRCIKLIKGDSKDIYNVTKDFHFKYMLFFWTFCSSVNPEKKFLAQFSTLSSKSAYYYDFWRIIWHWRLE